MAIKITQEEITPELATNYMKVNRGNRNLSEKIINSYANQMRRGQWRLIGDPIRFSDTGKLLDGQHRLSAVIKYGKPIEFFVIRGLHDSDFQVMDTGKNRSAGDVVSILGMKNATSIAGTVRGILLFENGNYSDQGSGTRVTGVTNTDIINFIKKHKDIEEIVAHCYNWYYQFRFMPAGQVATLYWILSKKNQTKADFFFSKYATGIDLNAKSPIKARDRLMRDPENKTKLKSREKMAFFIHAWNAFRKNKEMENIRLGHNFKFPTPL